MTSSVVTGDRISQKTRYWVFPQNHCQARRTFAFVGDEPYCLANRSHCTVFHLAFSAYVRIHDCIMDKLTAQCTYIVY